MDEQELQHRLEVERLKIQVEQIKISLDGLGNVLRTRIDTCDKEVEKNEAKIDSLEKTAVRIHAYIAAIVFVFGVIAWIIDHRDLLP